MDNGKKVMASIGSAIVPVTAAYWTAGTHLHERLVEAQSTPLYQSLEASLASATGFTDPDRLTDVGTILVAIGLCKVAYEVAKPMVRGFARLYGAQLE